MKTIKLKKIANVITGFPFKGEQYSNIGIRTVRGENVTEGKLRWDTVKCWNQKFDKQQEYLLKADDVVIGMDGSKVGKNKAQIKEKDLPLLLAQRVACVRSLNGNDQVFLYYLINNPKFEGYVFRTQTGSSVPHISKAQIEDFEVPQIEVLIQQKIAKILFDLDAKIELNNRINSELEVMGKTLYDYWFVQFDFPDANQKPYKSTGGKMVLNEGLKREIPQGWGVSELGNILNTDLGGTPSTKNEKFWGGNIPWLNSGEIANFPIVESEAHITTEAISNSAATLMPAGTCVLSITRHLRPSILAIDACANQSVVGIFESGKFKSSFIYPYLINEIPRLMTLRSGAQQPHINKGTVDESLMIEPSQPILDRYYKKANPIYKQIINNSFQNQELASLRDWLLPMLMNGQVRVGEVAEELGMVAEESARYKK